MTKTFTENDLLRFLYEDLSVKERKEITKALVSEPHLRRRFKELEVLKEQLNQVAIKPPQRVVDRIISYSRNIETTDV